MTGRKRLKASVKSGRGAARARSSKARVKPGRVKGAGSTERQKNEDVDLEMYRPLKKPITVRIDADVLAWFKKEGSRYQTRINSALRRVMEQEKKESA